MAVTVQLRSGAQKESEERVRERDNFFGKRQFRSLFLFLATTRRSAAAQFFKVEDAIKVKSTLAAESLPKEAKVKS